MKRLNLLNMRTSPDFFPGPSDYKAHVPFWPTLLVYSFVILWICISTTNACETMHVIVNPSRTRSIFVILWLSSYRAVNIIHFGFKNQSFNIKKFCMVIEFMCFVWLSERTATFALYNNNQLRNAWSKTRASNRKISRTNWNVWIV
jgi:uncharacterized membrane protein YozB (DUF420 family)